ncbi:MAG: thiamine phosphate synthase [Nannocystaceae bacterium]
MTTTTTTRSTPGPRRPRLAGLYAIADLKGAAASDDEVEAMLALLGERPSGAGPSALQLRAKAASTAARIECLRRLAGPCADAGVLLLVNDDVEAALAGPPGVVGVHLGQEDLGPADAHVEGIRSIRARAEAAGRSDLVVGVSTHDLEQVARASGLPIDYVGFGPIFATATKIDHDPVVGLDGLNAAVQRSRHPVVAIGGLDPARARLAVEAGATAAAMISALLRSSSAATRAHVAEVARDLEAVASSALIGRSMIELS